MVVLSMFDSSYLCWLPIMRRAGDVRVGLGTVMGCVSASLGGLVSFVLIA